MKKMEEKVEKVLNRDAQCFLKKKMCIDVEDLINKILTDTSESINLFKKLIDMISTMILPYAYTSEICSLANMQNDKFINIRLHELYEKYKVTSNQEEYQIFDVIRHAFILYCNGGVYDVFKYMETEEWYPKVIIRENIGKRDDINVLDDEIVVYRGTSKDEFTSGNFSQSWTIDKNVAYDFAFHKYIGRPKYLNTIRVVLEAKVNKKNAYYFSKSDTEKEVIIDERKIIPYSPQIIAEKLLKNED